jgi:hypothetical protein
MFAAHRHSRRSPHRARAGWLATLLAGVALLLVASPRRPVQACSYVCPAVKAPRERAYPANGVAFRIPSMATDGMRIEAADGTPVPASARKVGDDFVFAPDQPLVPASVYRFHYDGRCYAGNPPTVIDPNAPPAPAMVEFETVAAGTPPTTTGVLQVVRQIRVSDPALPRTAMVTMTVVPSAELAPYVGVTEWNVTLDGRRIYQVDKAPTAAAADRWPIPSPSFWIITSCEAVPGAQWGTDTCGGTYTAQPGRYRLRIAPNVLGVAADPPALEMDVDVSCDGATLAPPFDGGVSDVPGGSDTWGGSETSDASGASKGRGGCDLGRSATGTGSAPSLAIVSLLAGLAAWRRRR